MARLEAELEAARPFLDLAKEIQADVARIAADDGATVDALASAMETIPQRERLAVVRAVFDRLSPREQWAVLARAFDDDDIRAALADERAARVEELERAGRREALARSVRAEHRLDTRDVPPQELLTLGLFRDADVRGALALGERSTTCARRLVLRHVGEDDTFQVIEDVFNPAGGYFVTAGYDRDTWMDDRLPLHARVRIGSICDAPDGRSFEPVLYIGGRVDVDVHGELREGRLHAGYVMVGDVDVSTRGGGTQ